MTDIGTSADAHDNRDDRSADGTEEALGSVAKKRLGLGFWLCVGWIVLIVLVAGLAPWLGLKDPTFNFVDVQDKGLPPYAPSADHWFGTDQDARDIFSRTIFGARISLVVGFSAVTFGFLVGGSIGLVSGFVRGTFDRITSFLMLTLLSFPSLILAILMTALLDRTLVTISLILGVLSVAPVGRLARSASMVFAEREFVLAAKTMGAKPSHIILRELLPNVLIPMSALALLGTAVAIVAEGGLAFLGLSVQKEITWGQLIRLGSQRRELETAPWISFAPIFALFLTVTALNYAGDRLRDYFDVRELAL